MNNLQQIAELVRSMSDEQIEILFKDIFYKGMDIGDDNVTIMEYDQAM